MNFQWAAPYPLLLLYQGPHDENPLQHGDMLVGNENTYLPFLLSLVNEFASFHGADEGGVFLWNFLLPHIYVEVLLLDLDYDP